MSKHKVMTGAVPTTGEMHEPGHSQDVERPADTTTRGARHSDTRASIGAILDDVSAALAENLATMELLIEHNVELSSSIVRLVNKISRKLE